jgi:hypothetical protein
MVSVICMKGKSHELQYAEFQGNIVIETYLKSIEMLVVNILGMTVSVCNATFLCPVFEGGQLDRDDADGSR